jgi:'Cold-shock' DNA-binding domain
MNGRTRPRHAAAEPGRYSPILARDLIFEFFPHGFGFIARDGSGKDVFVHISALAPSGLTAAVLRFPTLQKS